MGGPRTDLILRLWSAGHRLANVPSCSSTGARAGPRLRTDPASPRRVSPLQDPPPPPHAPGRQGRRRGVGRRTRRQSLRPRAAAQGETVRAFVDLPRKIGQSITARRSWRQRRRTVCRRVRGGSGRTAGGARGDRSGARGGGVAGMVCGGVKARGDGRRAAAGAAPHQAAQPQVAYPPRSAPAPPGPAPPPRTPHSESTPPPPAAARRSRPRRPRPGTA